MAQIVDERVRRQPVYDLCHLVQFAPADIAGPGMHKLPPHVGSQVGHASRPVAHASQDLLPKVVWIAGGGGGGGSVGRSTTAGPIAGTTVVSAVISAVESADDRTHVPGLCSAAVVAVVVVVVLDDRQPVRTSRLIVLVSGLARKTPDDGLVPASTDASREPAGRPGKDEEKLEDGGRGWGRGGGGEAALAR